jgi:predicted esterase
MIEIAACFALPGMAYLAPAAPGGTWYPRSFLAPLVQNQPHLDQALARGDAIVRDLEQRGARRDRIALVGFSQGACLAAQLVWRNPRRWGALVAFTGGLVGPPGTVFEPRGDLDRTPVLITTSDADAWVPVDRVRLTAGVFRAMNGAVEELVYTGADHVVSDVEIVLARRVLGGLLA